jgi:hypothetical protein
LTRDTITTVVEYENHIVYLRMKDGASVTLENTHEQFAAQAELTGTDTYAVLVDARNFVVMDTDSRKYMASYSNPRRVATALLTKNNLATRLLANIYMKVDRPNFPTKMFGEESEAVAWLKEKLDTYSSSRT